MLPQALSMEIQRFFLLMKKDTENIPVSVYGASKLSNEIIAKSYSKNFKLKAIGLRFLQSMDHMEGLIWRIIVFWKT